MNGQGQRGGKPGNRSQINGQIQNGQQPATPPQTNSQAQNGEQPADLPQTNGQAPVMIDFDAMVTKGVISQETCDKIKAYMEAHKPADLPEMNGQNPTDEQPATPPAANGEQPAALPETNSQNPTGEQPAEDTAPAQGGLLADLLKDGIITQAEYDALTAAQ